MYSRPPDLATSIMFSTDCATPSVSSQQVLSPRDEKTTPILSPCDEKYKLVLSRQTLLNPSHAFAGRIENKLKLVAGSHTESQHILASLEEAIESVETIPVSLITEIPRFISYENNQNLLKGGYHWGQRKLFNAEIEFLTFVSGIVDFKVKNYVIYVGAAPNYKGWELVKMFQKFTFIFIDPARFEISYGDGNDSLSSEQKGVVFLNRKPDENTSTRNDIQEVTDGNYIQAIKDDRNADTRLFLIEKYMTIELAEILSGLENIILMSDMRTNSNHYGPPTSADVCHDNALMFLVSNKLRPIYSSLKYREVYDFDLEDLLGLTISNSNVSRIFDETKKLGADFRGYYRKSKHVSQVGDIYLQTWAPISSCEARLWVSRDNVHMTSVFGKEGENEKFFNFFNVVYRPFYHFHNPCANLAIGFGNCYDCAREYKVLSDYYDNIYEYKETKSKEAFIYDTIIAFMATTGRPGHLMHACYYDVEPSSRTDRIKPTRSNRTHNTIYKGRRAGFR